MPPGSRFSVFSVEALMECALYDQEEGGICLCRLCPRRCRILPSQRGWCRTRWNDHGRLKALTYGLVTSAALDPIEKKPLAWFHPKSRILSLGSWGCSMNCLFCQNWEISQREEESRKVTPERILRLAEALTAQGNIGVAWTYNEPTLSFELIRDTAPLLHQAGLVNVMVTNGFIGEEALDLLLPLIDAWNIDLKGWDPLFYKSICGASREPVLKTIQKAQAVSHVELTNLVIPEENDDPETFEDMVRWIASLDRDMPLHITRFFPRWRMMNHPPTPVGTLVSLGNIARKYLSRVKIGNVSEDELAAHHWDNESSAG